MEVGTDYTGNYSRFSFDEAKRYFYMMKEQGVPVLDDEFNLLQDMQLTLVRRLIFDMFGDGSPNNGFSIVGTGAVNDFTIKGGDGTNNGAGHYYIGGYLLILPSDISYSTQEVAQAALTTPGVPRVDEVYLEVYLDEIDGTEDTSIIDPTIAIETSRRLKLRYLVKVAEGGATPADYVAANGITHHTKRLAVINRTATTTIDANMVVNDPYANIGYMRSIADTANLFTSSSKNVETISHEIATQLVDKAWGSDRQTLVTPQRFTAGTDFNTLTSQQVNNFDATGSPNSPDASLTWCFIEVFENAGLVYTRQIVYDMSLTRAWTRVEVNSVWSAWVSLTQPALADKASTLQTPRKIGGVSFDGSADINLPGVNTAGNQNTSGSAAYATNAGNAIGKNQTYNTTTYTAGVNYTNTTGRTIVILARAGVGATAGATLNGYTAAQSKDHDLFMLIIPNGYIYQFSGTIDYFLELT